MEGTKLPFLKSWGDGGGSPARSPARGSQSARLHTPAASPPPRPATRASPSPRRLGASFGSAAGLAALDSTFRPGSSGGFGGVSLRNRNAETLVEKLDQMWGLRGPSLQDWDHVLADALEQQRRWFMDKVGQIEADVNVGRAAAIASLEEQVAELRRENGALRAAQAAKDLELKARQMASMFKQGVQQVRLHTSPLSSAPSPPTDRRPPPRPMRLMIAPPSPSRRSC